MWLLNTEDPLSTVLDFGRESDIAGVMLYDARAPYDRYYPIDSGSGGPYAPYPLQVVLDRDGVIQLISHQYDAAALNAALDAALAD